MAAPSRQRTAGPASHPATLSLQQVWGQERGPVHPSYCGPAKSPRRYGLGHQQHPQVFSADASLQLRGQGWVGPPQNLSILVAPASPFTKNPQRDLLSIIRCPCPRPLCSLRPAAPHMPTLLATTSAVPAFVVPGKGSHTLLREQEGAERRRKAHFRFD